MRRPCQRCAYPGSLALKAARESAKTWSQALDRSFCYAYGCCEVLEKFRPRPIDLIVGRSTALSWSLPDAMATSCAVPAADVPLVRELIKPVVDAERMTRTALEVFADPATFAHLGRAARRTIEEAYGLEARIPPLREFFERITHESRLASMQLGCSNLEPF